MRITLGLGRPTTAFARAAFLSACLISLALVPLAAQERLQVVGMSVNPSLLSRSGVPRPARCAMGLCDLPGARVCLDPGAHRFSPPPTPVPNAVYARPGSQFAREVQAHFSLGRVLSDDVGPNAPRPLCTTHRRDRDDRDRHPH